MSAIAGGLGLSAVHLADDAKAQLRNLQDQPHS